MYIKYIKAAQKVQQIESNSRSTRLAAGVGTTGSAASEKATLLIFTHKLKLVNCYFKPWNGAACRDPWSFADGAGKHMEMEIWRVQHATVLVS